MKYGSGTSTAGTSGGGQQQHYGDGVINVGAAAMFSAMDAGGAQQSSVIKTAPPGRANSQQHQQQQQQQQMLMDFSPKQEPIDLAPLTSTHPCLQDLGKMSVVGNAQLEHYYSSMSAVSNSQAKAAAYSASPYYEYLNVGSAAAYHHAGQGPSASALLQPNAAAAVVALGGGGGQQHVAQHQDWPYMSYTAQHHHQQQQQQLGYLGQLDGCDVLGQQQQRLYKNGGAGGLLNGSNENGGAGAGGGGLLSPVDSGIGQELLLEQAKQLHEFFGPVSLSSAVLVPTPQQQQQSSVIHQSCHASELIGGPGQSASSQQRQHSSSNRSEHEHRQEQQRLHEPREQSIPVVIPKLENSLGFQYTLEAPISTSIRKEDDRMTYVNKGQFYTVSLDYLPDMRHPLKGLTVRSQLMVVFREDKSYEDEIRTWCVWYKRQHSAKQRIIEVDTKNSTGAIGGFEEIAHNAVQFCWNPAEQPGPKVSIAVQCLSTDFSTQKGVKGLPLHVQIDTYDDQADSKTPFHRGYCQIKVFCDKGAERKLRDEDKRASKRAKSNGAGGSPTTPQSMLAMASTSTTSSTCSGSGGNNNGGGGGGGGRRKAEGEFHAACDRSQFYHSAEMERSAALFIPGEDTSFFFDTSSIGSFEGLSELEPQAKRPRPSERVMIYVRKPDEEVFTPLHLVPPTLAGLARAISEKYNLDETKIEAFYKQCQKGVTVKIDDDMLRHYSNQDTFLLELKQSELDRHTFYAVTLVELHSANNQQQICHPSLLANGGAHQSQTPSATSSSSTASEVPHQQSLPAPPSSSSIGTTNGQLQRNTAIW